MPHIFFVEALNCLLAYDIIAFSFGAALRQPPSRCWPLRPLVETGIAAELLLLKRDHFLILKLSVVLHFMGQRRRQNVFLFLSGLIFYVYAGI